MPALCVFSLPTEKWSSQGNGHTRPRLTAQGTLMSVIVICPCSSELLKYPLLSLFTLLPLPGIPCHHSFPEQSYFKMVLAFYEAFLFWTHRFHCSHEMGSVSAVQNRSSLRIVQMFLCVCPITLWNTSGRAYPSFISTSLVLTAAPLCLLFQKRSSREILTRWNSNQERQNTPRNNTSNP